MSHKLSIPLSWQRYDNLFLTRPVAIYAMTHSSYSSFSFNISQRKPSGLLLYNFEKEYDGTGESKAEAENHRVDQ